MTQNPSIYRIDKKNRLIKDLKNIDLVLETIINTSFTKLGFNSKFNSSDLNKFTYEDISYFLYLYNTNEIDSDWQEFLPKELTQNGDFRQQKLSLILFIQTEFEIFCIIGGNAYQIVLPFIDHSFGLNTYARIMKPESDELVSIKSRGITGTRAGINEQFRDNFRIIDFIKFGKIPQEIHLKLCIETSNLHFDFLKNKRNERIQIFVGKGFKIKKGVDFNLLHQIIKELCSILEISPSDYLSSYKEISESEVIYPSLHPTLIDKLYNDISNVRKGLNGTFNRFEFDFCNPNSIEKFYEADEYKLKELTKDGGHKIFNIVNDKDEIYRSVINRAIEKTGDNDRFNFMVYLQGVRVTCYKNSKKTTSSSFLFHFNTEFKIQGKPVFLIDTKWYYLRDSFVKDLRTHTEHILKTHKAPSNILDIPWDKAIIKKEKEYNLLYDARNNYLVTDTIIIDGVELCDVLHYDDKNIYLAHIKFGFSSKIRELTNQVTISARRLRETLGTKERLLLEKIYNQLVEKGYNINNLNLDEFKNLFNKKITYILAFTSHLNEDILVEENIDKFDSNIARFSLIQCSSDMRANYYNMETYQITRK